jgi:lysozyme
MAMPTPALLIRRIMIAIGAILLAGVLLWFFATRWAPSRTTYPSQGVDVSAGQGDIDWRKLRAAGADFAYIRASEGSNGRDLRFAENWAAAREAGVRRGALHIFTLCRPARDQATNFIATVPREDNMLPPAITLAFDERCPARPQRKLLLAEIAVFIEMVEAYSGQAVILNLAEDFEETYQISTMINRSLWLRRMFFAPDYGTHPWVIWQASQMRRIDGIAGPVNWNIVQP